MLHARTITLLAASLAPLAAAQAPDVLHFTFDQGLTVNASPSGIGPAVAGTQVDRGPGLCGDAALSTATSTSCFIDTGWDVDLGTGSWTVGCWLDRTHTSLPSSSLQFVLGGGGLEVFVGGNAGNTGILLRGPSSSSFDDVALAHGGELRPVHVVWTYDEATRTSRGYVDGELVNVVLQTGAPADFTGGPFYLLNAPASSFNSAPSPFSLAPGYMLDEVRVYRRAIPESEVDAWYACGADLVGTSYCAPAVQSSGFRSGVLFARGSNSIAMDDVELVAGFLPRNTFGMYLTSRDAAFVVQPGGSRGNLCLGGAIGRFVGPGQVGSSGPEGRLSLELDHRVKNSLAQVLGLAEQTLRSSETLPQFREAFVGRLRSLARTHEALASGRWRGISLAEIVRRSVESLMEAGRLRLEGPPVALTARVSSALGLSLHELATNALKYGALRRERGIVEVRWATGPAGILELHWRERGGESVVAPARSGLGTKLIRGMIEHELGGAVTLSFEDEGLLCLMTIPGALQEFEPDEGRVEPPQA